MLKATTDEILFHLNFVPVLLSSNDTIVMISIRLSKKFFSFYKGIIDAQYFLFYFILLYYVRSILFQ